MSLLGASVSEVYWSYVLLSLSVFGNLSHESHDVKRRRIERNRLARRQLCGHFNHTCGRYRDIRLQCQQALLSQDCIKQAPSCCIKQRYTICIYPIKVPYLRNFLKLIPPVRLPLQALVFLLTISFEIWPQEHMKYLCTVVCMHNISYFHNPLNVMFT